MNQQLKTVLLTVLTLSVFVIALVELSGVSKTALINKFDGEETHNHSHDDVAATAMLAKHEEQLRRLVDETVSEFPGITTEFVVKEQYRNMKEMLDKHPQVMANAAEAYTRAGLTPVKMSIRGGTDGSRLSFMGLPCPNLFTGEMGIHSKQEYVSVQDMQKSVEVLVHLAQVWAEKA